MYITHLWAPFPFEGCQFWSPGDTAFTLLFITNFRNYGPTLYIQMQAQERGCQQVLWLFGDDHTLTEAGTMNIFVHLINEDGGELIWLSFIDQFTKFGSLRIFLSSGCTVVIGYCLWTYVNTFEYTTQPPPSVLPLSLSPSLPLPLSLSLIQCKILIHPFVQCWFLLKR